MIAEISTVSVVGEEIVSVEADWTSSGRLLQSRGPAVENERSPTVTIVVKDGRHEVWK